MKGCYLEKWLKACSVLYALFSSNLAAAQVVGDTTMPLGERSLVTGNPNFQIDGGARRGANLFHSFSQFSVPTGGSAYFNNAADVQNILTRVTGSSVSNIDGLIRTNGTANLFLLNPTGIIFGKNASLNVGGSFVATTANAIGFGNLGFFSASTPEAPSSLLTINPSALLFNQIAASPIQNSSTAPAGTTLAGADALGLRVRNGRSLLLVGGNISLDGGGLNALGGRVELGGLASAGTVGLNGDGNNLSLSFPDSVARSDVSLSNGAQVNVFAGNGGSIAVNARNLEMTGVSGLYAGIDSGLGSNTSQAGNISVNATGAVNLNNSEIANQVQPQAKGQGGDISISASTLRLEGGGQIYTVTYGEGKSGSLSVDAQDVQIIGGSADGQYPSGLSTSAEANSTGDAGNLTIKTNTLLVRDGAQVVTGTRGAGNGGTLSVDAQDVQIIGTTTDGRYSSLLSTSAQRNSTGDAGNLTIKTNTLLVRDGAQVSADTFGVGKGGSLSVDAQDVQLIGTTPNGWYPSALGVSAQPNSTGDAGNLTLKTNTLLVRDGAQVNNIAFGTGKGGTLSVDAQDVQLIGRSADGEYSSGLATSAQRNSTGDAGDLTLKTNTLLVRDGAQVSTITFGTGKAGDLSVDAQDVQLIGRSADGDYSSGLLTSAEPYSTGDAGNLTLKTNTLLVQDGATVTVESRGTGTAGNLTIDADSIRLDNDSALRANTRSSKVDPNREQATININSQALVMTGGSNIITNASGANVIGGNINIDADVLVGLDDSDITANSANFRGGNVRIDTQGIFGIQFRDVASPQTSDITATGATNQLKGNVQITRPDVDPTSGLVELPADVVDRSGLIAQGCRDVQGSSFVVSGRGGLPPTPQQALGDDPRWRDWRTPAVVSRQPNAPRYGTLPPPANPHSTKPALVEATGWVTLPSGKVILTASAPNVTSPDWWRQPVNCDRS